MKPNKHILLVALAALAFTSCTTPPGGGVVDYTNPPAVPADPTVPPPTPVTASTPERVKATVSTGALIYLASQKKQADYDKAHLAIRTVSVVLTTLTVDGLSIESVKKAAYDYWKVEPLTRAVVDLALLWVPVKFSSVVVRNQYIKAVSDGLQSALEASPRPAVAP